MKVTGEVLCFSLRCGRMEQSSAARGEVVSRVWQVCKHVESIVLFRARAGVAQHWPRTAPAVP